MKAMVCGIEVAASRRERTALWSEIFKLGDHEKDVTFERHSQAGMFIACSTYSPVMYLRLSSSCLGKEVWSLLLSQSQVYGRISIRSSGLKIFTTYPTGFSSLDGVLILPYLSLPSTASRVLDCTAASSICFSVFLVVFYMLW